MLPKQRVRFPNLMAHLRRKQKVIQKKKIADLKIMRPSYFSRRKILSRLLGRARAIS